MPHAAPQREPASPDQLLRLFRGRPRVGSKKKLRQIDLAALVGVETRTLQLWESGEHLPSPDNLQRLIGVPLVEHLLLPGEEEQEARLLWETVTQAYEERPGTYRLYPSFDERWFRRLLHDATHMLTEEQRLHQKVQVEKRGEHTRSGVPYTPTNLCPHPTTSFIGRGPDLAEIKQLLVHTHFVTLTGAGGCRKTMHRSGGCRLAHHTH